MKLYRIVPASALAIALLAGCSQPTEPVTTPAEAPAPAESTEAQASATTTPTTAALAEPYRVITDHRGNTKVEFTLMINGATVGSYNTDDVKNDISSYLTPGQNTIKVAWTADGSMNSAEKARLKIQTQRGGEWNDIVTREVTADMPAGEAETKIQVGPITPDQMSESQENTQGTNGEIPTEPTPTMGTSVEQAPIAPANSNPAGLSEKYIVKTDFNTFTPGSFEVSINGNSVGSYSTDSNQDITGYLKKGSNRMAVKWQGKSRNMFAKSTLTVGVNRGEKWSTVGNATIMRDSLAGSKTFEFTAQ